MTGSSVASAPGKIMLAGEYAVLEGHAALLAAVPRRVVATLGETGEGGPFLQAVAEVLEAELGPTSAAARAARRVTVDSSALRVAETKLGLGSSAAVTVAATALALGQLGPLGRDQCLRLAHRAHRRAQSRLGAPGSGADVAACTFGGLCAIRGSSDEGPCAVEPLTVRMRHPLLLAWTGRSASTPRLVARVRAAGAHSDRGYRACIAALVHAALALQEALCGTDPRLVVAAVDQGGRAVASLGDFAGVPLWIPEHDALRERARRLGGSIKPTGAGGGDLALAAFPSADAAARFFEQCQDHDTVALPLDEFSEGVRLQA